MEPAPRPARARAGVRRRRLVDRRHARLAWSARSSPRIPTRRRRLVALAPWRGTYADLDAEARRLVTLLRDRASSPARWSPSSSRTGARRSSRSPRSRWAATCSSRSSTSTAARRWRSSSSRAARVAYVSPLAYGHVDYVAIVDGAAPASLRLHVVVGDGDLARARAGVARIGWDGVRRPQAGDRARRGRPDDGGGARVHVGHDERPEGRDARPPHAAQRARAT